jgi:hypothetical protein
MVAMDKSSLWPQGMPVFLFIALVCAAQQDIIAISVVADTGR